MEFRTNVVRLLGVRLANKNQQKNCCFANENVLSANGRKNRLKFLLMNKAVVILLITSSLADIDTSACNMAEYLIKEMAKKQGVTEQLKAEDMMKWVGLMNNIRACADEILLNDIVYS